VNGGAPMSPEVASRVVKLFRRFRPPVRADYDLSPHEARLLKLMVEGHQYKSAAGLLGVTVHTVSFHLRRIYDKLQVHSKSEAIVKALRSGLFDRPPKPPLHIALSGNRPFITTRSRSAGAA